MNCWIKYLVIVALIFLITYNPKTGNIIEKITELPTENEARDNLRKKLL